MCVGVLLAGWTSLKQLSIDTGTPSLWHPFLCKGVHEIAFYASMSSLALLATFPLLLAREYPVFPPPQLTSFCRSYLFAVNCMEIVRAIEKVEQAQRQSGIVPASLFR